MLYISDFYLLYLIALLGAIIAFVKGQPLWGIILLIYALSGIIYFFRYGTINKAIEAFNNGNLRKAKKLLNFIPTERYFSEEYKALYYFLKGIIFYNEKNIPEAEKFILKAVNSHKLPTEYQEIAIKLLYSKK